MDMKSADIYDILDEIDDRDDDIWQRMLNEIRTKKGGTLIKNMINSRTINVNAKHPKNGKTLLIYSVIIGDFDLVKIILNFGADIHLKDDEGLDALDYAMKYGRYKITEMLYYRQLSGSLGTDLKHISMRTREKTQEALHLYNYKSKYVDTKVAFHKQMIEFVIDSLNQRAPIDESMLFYAWYFESMDRKEKVMESELWNTMMNVYTQIIENTKDKTGWNWLREKFVPCLIWYLPHPIYTQNEDENDEKETEIQETLKETLFYELLIRVQREAKKQSDLLLTQNDEWKELIPYNIESTKEARQDSFGCLKPKYKETDLSEDIYPPSTHFAAKKHYDANIYLNELIFTANLLNDEFQNDMRLNTQEIAKEMNENVIFRMAPVKTLSRAQFKVENDYINEEYPSSAKILDIIRCAIQFNTSNALTVFIEKFTQKVEKGETRCIKQVVRCKNGWSVYDENHPQYTDIKLNVVVSGKEGAIIAELQFLLELMSNFKKKAHKLYSIERKFELVYNHQLLKKELHAFKDCKDEDNVMEDIIVRDDIQMFHDLWRLNADGIKLLLPKKPMAPHKTFLYQILTKNKSKISDFVVKQWKGYALFSLFCQLLKQKKVLTQITDQKRTLNTILHCATFDANNLCKNLSFAISTDINVKATIQSVIENQTATSNVLLMDKMQMILDLNEYEMMKEYKAFNVMSLQTPNIKETTFKFISYKHPIYSFGTYNLSIENDQMEYLPPTELSMRNISKFVTHSGHSLILHSNGSLSAFGRNDKGQLGLGDTLSTQINTPTQINIPFKSKIVDIAVSLNYSMLLTANGKVYHWGASHREHGTEIVTTPTIIPALPPIYAIFASYCASFALSSKPKEMFIWGHFYGYQMYRSFTTPKPVDLQLPDPLRSWTTQPFDIENIKSVHWTGGLRNNEDGLIVLAKDGSVYTSYGLSKSNFSHTDRRPFKCHLKKNPKFNMKAIRCFVTAGSYHYMISDDGDLYVFGWPSYKGTQVRGLGNISEIGAYNKKTAPKKITYFSEKGIKIKQCFDGDFHTAVVTDNDDVYMFGHKSAFGTKEDQVMPLKMDFFNGAKIDIIALGNAATFISPKTADKLQEMRMKRDEWMMFRNEIKDNIHYFDVYAQNAMLCGAHDWALIHRVNTVPYPIYSNLFIEYLQMIDDKTIKLKNTNEIEEKYHKDILKSTYLVLINEKEERVKMNENNMNSKNVYRGFSNIASVIFELSLKEIQTDECKVGIYVQLNESMDFMLLKEFMLSDNN